MSAAASPRRATTYAGCCSAGTPAASRAARTSGCSASPRTTATSSRRIWQPAVTASGIGFEMRMHDLLHAPASWLLAGGSDLASVIDRLGHAHVQTTQQYLHAPADADADQRNLDALDAPILQGLRASIRLGAIHTQLGDYIAERALGQDDLLFATRDGTPISRNTFRTRV